MLGRARRVALERIDLRTTRAASAHGALDVLPFVPLRGATLADAAALAHRAEPKFGGAMRTSYYYARRRERPNDSSAGNSAQRRFGCRTKVACPAMTAPERLRWSSRRPNRVQYRAGYHRSSSGPYHCSGDSRTHGGLRSLARPCLAGAATFACSLAQRYGLCCNPALIASWNWFATSPPNAESNCSAASLSAAFPCASKLPPHIFGSHDAVKMRTTLLALLLGLCAPQAAPAQNVRATLESSRRRCATAASRRRPRIERLRRPNGHVVRFGSLQETPARPAWRNASNT